MNDKVQYWVEISDYDLETAEAMLKSKRYLYVGFMCHQAIEKVFKAYFTGVKSETAPFSHSLSYLAKKGDLLRIILGRTKRFYRSNRTPKRPGILLIKNDL